MPLDPITLPINLVLSAQSNALLRALLAAEDTATATPAAEPPTNAMQPPAMGDYWKGQGGLYLCTLPPILDMPARHLIAANLERKDMSYGPAIDVPGATSHVNGAANTAALLATGQRHPAAEFAAGHTADGHSDFFLPSRYDLLMTFLLTKGVLGTDGWYLSSTQGGRHNAFVQDFENGDSYWGSKAIEFRVRPVRVIPL